MGCSAPGIESKRRIIKGRLRTLPTLRQSHPLLSATSRLPASFADISYSLCFRPPALSILRLLLLTLNFLPSPPQVGFLCPAADPFRSKNGRGQLRQGFRTPDLGEETGPINSYLQVFYFLWFIFETPTPSAFAWAFASAIQRAPG